MVISQDGQGSVPQEPVLIPVQVGDCRLLLSAYDLSGELADRDTEIEIASSASVQHRMLNGMLDGLAAFATGIVDRFEPTSASKVSVQFDCNVALESGTLVAVVGKASWQRTFTVTVEWTRDLAGG
ncbi:hypothetical protein EAS64_41970 [Trebonia kvetii]|uniref:Trypsin-co-occurring domain-containing protein n=1 Tax=Trebonia kvetii TaxID=2480626 RepID=A0A6P2BN82_9ACTN|nr:CU044_2847 family protein [Trebonia kvetii]TVY99130.1 hypothetical protein EAS64_41970 [Trebonia kvetii]